MADMKKFVSGAKTLAKDAWVEAIEEKEIQLMDEGASRQRENDIYSAIMGFLDLKASDVQIYDLLQRYFGIDSISAAHVYIKVAKDLLTAERFKSYLKEQNNGNWNMDLAMLMTQLRHSLEKDSKYQLKDPAKIVAALRDANCQK